MSIDVGHFAERVLRLCDHLLGQYEHRDARDGRADRDLRALEDLRSEADALTAAPPRDFNLEGLADLLK